MGMRRNDFHCCQKVLLSLTLLSVEAFVPEGCMTFLCAVKQLHCSAGCQLCPLWDGLVVSSLSVQ